MKLQLRVFFTLALIGGLLFPALSASGEIPVARFFNLPSERISITMEKQNVQMEMKARAKNTGALIDRQFKIGRAILTSA